MKSVLIGVACIVVLAGAVPAPAELQNVTIGGSVRIRGNWYNSAATGDSLTARNPFFQGPGTPSFRGVGGNPLAGARWAAQPGRLAVWGWPDWDSRGPNAAFVDQRTTCAVDEVGRRLHGGKLVASDHTARLLALRKMERHKV